MNRNYVAAAMIAVWTSAIAVGAVSASLLTGASIATPEQHLQVQLDTCTGVCEIAPGHYTLSEPLELRNPRVKVNAYGVEFQSTGLHDGLIIRKEAEGSVWQGGTFRGTNTSTAPTGITIQGPVVLRDVGVYFFGLGIKIWCGDGYEPAHCNMWKLYDVTTSGNLLDGLHVRGSDANAGLAVGLNAQTNCAAASRLYSEPTADIDKSAASCAQIHDQSFLGNTYIAPHTASSLDRSTEERFFQVRSDTSNGRTTWLGAYTENGTWGAGNGPSRLRGQGHYAVGGINGIETVAGATRFRERGSVNALNFRGAQLPNYPTASLCFGECDSTGSPFVGIFSSAPGSSARAEFRLRPVNSLGTWEVEYGLASRHYLFRLDLTKSASDPSWLDMIPNPYGWDQR